MSPYIDDAIIGTPAQVAEQLQAFVELGVEHFTVRLLDFHNTMGIELFEREVISQLST